MATGACSSARLPHWLRALWSYGVRIMTRPVHTHWLRRCGHFAGRLTHWPRRTNLPYMTRPMAQPLAEALRSRPGPRHTHWHRALWSSRRTNFDQAYGSTTGSGTMHKARPSAQPLAPGTAVYTPKGSTTGLGVVAVATRDVAVLLFVVAASGGVRCAAHQDRAARQQEQLLHYPAQHQLPEQRGRVQQL